MTANEADSRSMSCGARLERSCATSTHTRLQPFMTVLDVAPRARAMLGPIASVWATSGDYCAAGLRGGGCHSAGLVVQAMNACSGSGAGAPQSEIFPSWNLPYLVKRPGSPISGCPTMGGEYEHCERSAFLIRGNDV